MSHLNYLKENYSHILDGRGEGSFCINATISFARNQKSAINALKEVIKKPVYPGILALMKTEEYGIAPIDAIKKHSDAWKINQ